MIKRVGSTEEVGDEILNQNCIYLFTYTKRDDHRKVVSGEILDPKVYLLIYTRKVIIILKLKGMIFLNKIGPVYVHKKVIKILK